MFPRQVGDRLRWVGADAASSWAAVSSCSSAPIWTCTSLTDLRQLRDREVQLHKTIAVILMTIVGTMVLRRIKRSPAAPPRDLSRLMRWRNSGAPGAAGEPAAEPLGSAGVGASSKPIALMALIGGGLLFTHVHTVAPYANVAAGVYVAAHDSGHRRAQRSERRGCCRTFGLPTLPPVSSPSAFAALMCVESVLLITYNEGLPWYLGYGNGTTAGDPHGGTDRTRSVRTSAPSSPTTTPPSRWTCTCSTGSKTCRPG